VEKTVKWRFLFLAAWVCGILFPFEALRTYSESYRQSFDTVFDHEAAHVLMHLFLFAVLAGGLRAFLKWPWVLLAAAGIAGLQEAIQALTASQYEIADGFFDLGVDMAGAVAGLIVFRLARAARHRLESRA
jgi:glucan phosphoethanolaminetransferase (alkaline phosphatase superfamily)